LALGFGIGLGLAVGLGLGASVPGTRLKVVVPYRLSIVML